MPEAVRVEVEEIQCAESLERLRPEWSELWKRCPDATPFQAPEWLLPWWRRCGSGAPWVLCARARGALVGLLPLAVDESAPASRVRRRVFLMGTGISDYLDGLIEGRTRDDVLGAFFAVLAARRSRWDVCDLECLRPGSPLLDARIPSALDGRMRPQECCPVLRLPPELGNLPECVGRHRFKKLAYTRRRLEHSGSMRLVRADGNNLERLLEVLFSLHRARWNRRGLPGALSGGEVERFHREIAPGFLARGWLRLHVAFHEGVPAAGLYGFLARRRMYYYLGGFAPELEKLSPGSYIVLQAIEEAVREGAAWFDFLRGREPYKYSWGARDEPVYWRRVRPARVARERARTERRAGGHGR